MFKVYFWGLKNLLHVPVVVVLLMGCSSKTFIGHAQWAQNSIAVDGTILDWPQLPPIYYDEDNRMSVQMINNNEALYIYLSVAGKDLKKGFVKDGLSLSLEPVGMATSPFKLTFKDHQDIKIFYPSEPDPIMMPLAEAYKKGIEVRMKQPGRIAMVFEAKIGFDTIYPPTGILPGTHLIVKIESTRMEIFEEFNSGESMGGSKGGRGVARGRSRENGSGRSGGKRSAGNREEVMEPYEVTLEVILASGMP